MFAKVFFFLSNTFKNEPDLLQKHDKIMKGKVVLEIIEPAFDNNVNKAHDLLSVIAYLQ